MSQDLNDFKSSIICQPYDINIKDAVMNDEGIEHVNIHLWCLDREDKPVLVRVTDFPAYCYVELPTLVNGNPFAWDYSSAAKVNDYLKWAMKDRNTGKDNSPFEWHFGRFQKLYYYKGDIKYPMILFKFRTMEAMKHCNNLLSKPRNVNPYGVLQFNIYEANIDIIRKFHTTIDATFCQWLNVSGMEHSFESENRIATAGTETKPIREISVSYKNIKPISSSESEAWFTHPRILAFDIETYSDNHKAFPNYLNSKHVCNIISCIYYEIGNVASRVKYVIVLGDTKDIPDAVVIRVQTELELLHAFCDLIEKLDPEIISGYNIFAYDYPYLDNRLKIKLQDWKPIGRIMDKKIEMSRMEWKSGAYGTNVINILQMDGRLSIDMLPIVKRDYKLDKYSLEFVSNTFLGRGKLDVTPVEMFRAYERQAFIIRECKKYIQSKLGINATNWMIKDSLDKISESIPEEAEKCKKLYTRYELALDEVTRIVAYCIIDSDLVVDLFDKLNVWIGLNALSSVVGVTIIQLFTRGQQVRCLSQVYDKATRMGIVLDRRKKDPVFYEGGFVFEPKPGLYTGVICLDFASLYPSIMRAYNICFTTLVPQELNDDVSDEVAETIEVNQEEPEDGAMKPKKLNADGEEIPEGFDNDDASDDEDESKKKTIMKTYKYKWVRKSVRYGVLPAIQDHLVGSRNVIKKEIAALEDELDECSDPKRLAEIKMLLVLKDKYSNALKVSANSLYGFLGAQESGVLALIEAAMCITATGRRLIQKVNSFVEDKYAASVVYGDTDSSMIDMHVPIKEVFQRGLDLAQEITYGTPEKILEDGTIIPASPALFPPPLKIEFEKAMKMCCIKKKKYAALYIDKNGEFMREKKKDGSLGDYKILKRGIIVARRDTAKIVHKTYNKLLMMVLKEEPIKDSFNLIIDTLDDLMNDRLSARENLSIIRAYGTYKSDTYFMKIFGDELIRMGKPVNPSDRLEYVIVKADAEKDWNSKKDYPLGLKMRLIEMYEDSRKLNDNSNTDINKGSVEILDETDECNNTHLKQTIDPSLILDHPDDPLRVPDESTAMYPSENIDYEYYIEHVLKSPIDQLFSIGYMTKLSKLLHIGYQPFNKNAGAVPITEPIRMISKMISDYQKQGKTFEEIKPTIPQLKEYFSYLIDNN